MKKLLLGLTFLASMSSYASYRSLPANFDDLSLFCSTWDSFDSDSMEQSLEKFSISKLRNGVRTISFNNAKSAFVCEENASGLRCEGYAYQVYDDQYLEDTTENQKFEVIVELDYSKHRSNLIEGLGIVPSGFFGRKSIRSLYCEIQGYRKY